MLVNEEFKREIKNIFTSSFETALVNGADGSRWQFRERSSLDNLKTQEFFILTMSSQLFRILIFLHFSKNSDTEKYVNSILNTPTGKLDDHKFYDYLGEVGNGFLGAIKRDIGKYVPSLGMSTPNRLGHDCLKYMKNFNVNYEAHASANFDDKTIFYASVYLVADEDLNIRIERQLQDAESDAGELEFF